ncbi:MAG: hypothetical protein ACOH1Y_17355 [Propionicimonas sp.]
MSRTAHDGSVVRVPTGLRALEGARIAGGGHVVDRLQARLGLLLAERRPAPNLQLCGGAVGRRVFTQRVEVDDANLVTP